MYRPGSSLSKANKGGGSQNQYGLGIKVKQENKEPQFDEYVKKRDWIGAIAILEHQQSHKTDVNFTLWLAYCKFHVGDYRKCILLYDSLQKSKDYDKMTHLYKACCYYALQQYDDSKREASKGPECELQNRLLFHLAHKKNDEKNLMTYHYKLQDNIEDQLSLAAIHFLRSHFEEATDIYKKLLQENREYHALNYYIALCYYKMDYYEVSLEILAQYLQKYPSSVIATNLKACNQFQLYSGKAAEEIFRQLQNLYEGGDIFQDNDLLRHNLVVFTGGENASQILRPLVEIFPEAKLNLAIHYLKNDEVDEAFRLIKDIEPNIPREYIIKAVVYAMLGQKENNRDHIKVAQQLYQLVGSSASECDTIPGRCCMSSCFFLLKQFDDVLVYLETVKSFYQQEDDFLWNYGIAMSATGKFQEAEESFLQIQNESYLNDIIYIKWLTRTYIMGGKPQNAWELYLNMENQQESFILLQQIANDCYKMGHFYFAAKSFDILVRLDSEQEYEDALRGSVVGVFQMVIAQKADPEQLVDVLNILKSLGNNPQVEYIFRVVSKWAKDNNINL